MTASWDSFQAPPRPRRVRGGEIPPPSPTTWRDQRRAARQAALARPGGGAAPAAPGLGLQLGPLRLDADALFAFALFLPMLFLVQWGSKSAAMIVGVTPIYLFVRRKQLPRVLLPRVFLFAFPAYALLSVLWSEAPRESLKFALELAVTVTAGLLLSSAKDQTAVLRAIALAFLIYVAKALASGGNVWVGGASGSEAFAGLSGSKNLMADIASTGLLVSAAVGIMATRERNWLWMALGGAAVLLDLYVVAAAHSAGALLGLAMGLAPLLALTPLVSLGKALRAWATATIAIALVIMGLFYRTIAQAMIDLAATLFDKDPTLTGRTYLWYRAADLIREKPVLGRGYFAFWLQGNIDAEGIWRYAGISGRGGFNFHNTLVDILVTLGWVGAAVFVAVVLIGALALVRRFVQRPSLSLVFWISILLYVVSRTPIETLGIQPFYFSTVLVFGALSAAFGRLGEERVAHRPQRAARLVQVRPIDYAGEAARANPRLAPVLGSLRLSRNPGEVSR